LQSLQIDGIDDVFLLPVKLKSTIIPHRLHGALPVTVCDSC